MKELTICSTYDESFEPMCAHFCSNFRNQAGIKIRLNRIRTEGKASSFGSAEWYESLRQKIVFLEKCMMDIDDGDVICCSDTDIQFFRPGRLIGMKLMMEATDLEYVGQKEHIWEKYNGGFFLIKKNEKTIDFVRKINSSDLSVFKYAEQELINELIKSMNIVSEYLDPRRYLHGCLAKHPDYGGNENVVKEIVMHHATCAFDLEQKMRQMNDVRKSMGIELIDWGHYLGYEDDSWK